MERKRVYITVDDGPSKDFRAKVEYLSERSIPAVFFCEGENLRRYEEDVAYAIDRGYIIGNHSYRHAHFSDMSIEECKESIWTTDALIERIYGKYDFTRPMKLFRFPHFDQGGDVSGEAYENKWSRPKSEWFSYPRQDRREAIQAFLRELGYIQPQFHGINLKYFVDKTMLDAVDVRSTFDQMEYYLGDENAPYGMCKEEAILGRIDEDVPYEGRSLNCYDTTDIILIHDDERTTDLFYRIIDRYCEKGFEFIGL